jgi:hypothetical protein
MKSSKAAPEIVPGDKIFLDTAPSKPVTVTASYPLGDRWAVEVQGVQQIIQLDQGDTVAVWTQ